MRVSKLLLIIMLGFGMSIVDCVYAESLEKTIHDLALKKDVKVIGASVLAQSASNKENLHSLLDTFVAPKSDPLVLIETLHDSALLFNRIPAIEGSLAVAIKQKITPEFVSAITKKITKMKEDEWRELLDVYAKIAAIKRLFVENNIGNSIRLNQLELVLNQKFDTCIGILSSKAKSVDVARIKQKKDEIDHISGTGALRNAVLEKQLQQDIEEGIRASKDSRPLSPEEEALKKRRETIEPEEEQNEEEEWDTN